MPIYDGRSVSRHPLLNPLSYVKIAPVLAGRVRESGAVITPEGEMEFEAGDYLVSDDPPTHLWPVKQSVFERTYRPLASRRSPEAGPRQIEFEVCEVCHSTEVARLPDNWQAEVAADNRAIPIVGCGNPFHYAVECLGDQPSATVYFTADAIDEALSTIRGSVTRAESVVMAAAGALAAHLRANRRVVTVPDRRVGRGWSR